MHVAAAIVGLALMANFGFCLAFVAIRIARLKREMNAMGMGIPLSPPIVLIPVLHAAGLAVGIGLVWWGLSG